MVSSDQPTYTAELVRLTGFDRRSPPLESTVGDAHTGRVQPLHTGSYGHVPVERFFELCPGGLTIQCWFMPTTPVLGRPQALLSRVSPAEGGFGIWIEPDGHLSFRISSGRVPGADLRSPVALVGWEWYFVAATYNPTTGQARLVQRPLAQWGMQGGRAVVQGVLPAGGTGAATAPLLFAASVREAGSGGWRPTDFFNGKLDSPRLFNRELSLAELAQLETGTPPAQVAARALVAAWDFSREIASVQLVDISGHELHGVLVNMPARAMTGHAWTADVLDVSQAPEQWSAISFHEDDLEDAAWTPEFEWRVPATLPSGVYAAMLIAGGETECVPFLVRPRPGSKTARIAFLVPTMTYVAYANYRQSAEAGEQMSGGSNIYELVTDRPIELSATDAFLEDHPELGLSHYETHADGTATYYSSRLRPIVTMRPGYGYWMTHAPRHFAADLLLIEWLESKGYDYDVITDEDLHAEGTNLLRPYRVVLTGSHPEYWTDAMLRGLESYLGSGGRLMYLGGNGLCWVTSVHPERPHVFEVRKGVFFVPMGKGVAGEACHSTTGERGGAWRDRGRAPQRLLGVGTTAMGWGPAQAYARLPGSFDERAAFIFDGIGADELIGGFGMVLGGAAGDEIDRFDLSLGSPPHTLLLASSSGRHTNHYQLLPWDVQTYLLGHGGAEDSRVRADMTYFETEQGGAVFSVGSINWIGSLMFNEGANNVSRVTENVLRRFISS